MVTIFIILTINDNNIDSVHCSSLIMWHQWSNC